MERVALLVEQTGQTLVCMLNPENLVFRRAAGLVPRVLAGGKLTGAGGQQDPLLATGGGRTEFTLDLLFDVELPGVNATTRNVKDLTGPLWRLAENSERTGRNWAPPCVRFIWGKAWNQRARVLAVSERLERFSSEGVPARSWLRMQLVCVDEEDPRAETQRRVPLSTVEQSELSDLESLLEEPPLGDADAEFVEVRGSGNRSGKRSSDSRSEGSTDGLVGEQLFLYAHEHLGDVRHWRRLARLNRIADPLSVEPGSTLRVPSRQG